MFKVCFGDEIIMRWLLYSGPDCNRCKMLKKWMRDNGVDFRQMMIDEDFIVGDLIRETARRGNASVSLPVLISGNVCYTERQLCLDSTQLDYKFLEENIR